MTDQILLRQLAELEVFGELPGDAISQDALYISDMIGRGVPYKPSVWFEEPLTPARSMKLSRAVKRLAITGLIERRTDDGRDRVRFLRPTVAGLQRAIALAKGQVNLTFLLRGLRRTAWAHHLADSLVVDQRRLPEATSWTI